MNIKRIEELLRMFNENAPIARYFGMKLSFTDEVNPVLSSPPGPWDQGPRAGQCAVIDLPYNPNLDHAFGGIHGGVYATMLDNADVSGATFTAAAAHDVSCWVATSELSIHFLEPAKSTTLRAVGRLLKQGKRWRFPATSRRYICTTDKAVGSGTALGRSLFFQMYPSDEV